MNVRTIILSLFLLAMPFHVGAATVSPATIDLIGNRNDVVLSTFSITNTQDTEAIYYLDTLAFQAKDETGEPKFTEQAENTLAEWIVLTSESVRVPARSKGDVPFTIQVPADIASGSYQSAITVSSAPSDIVATNGAIVEAKTAILVFLTVQGETQAQAALMDFEVGGWIRTDVPSSYKVRIQNQGNVYATPSGSITLKDVFGRVLQTIPVNEAHQRVLPKTTRTFTTEPEPPQSFLTKLSWQARHLSIGPIRAELELLSGEGFAPIRATHVFWYFPFPLLFVLLLAGLVITFGYKRLSRLKSS